MGTQGPGPAAYGLPTTIGHNEHDLRKIRLPEYSLGSRLKTANERLGPGPNIYKVDKLTRYGVSRANQFSLSPKVAAKGENRGPGPAAHDIQKAGFRGPKPPAYTIGERLKFRAENGNPSPNSYAYKTETIKPGIPSFTIAHKTQFSVNGQSPGPAAYDETNLNVKKRRNPEYSMGVKTSYRLADRGPGPNAYDLSNYKPGKSGKQYTFGIHHSPNSPPLVVPCDR